MSRFIFIANSKSFELEITGSTEEETTVNTYWVLSPFVTSMNQETGAAQVAYYQQNTEELRERVRDIVTKIKHLNPRINRLTDYFEKELTPNEWFFLSVDEALHPEDTDKILAELMKIGADEKMEKQINGTIEILHKIREVYDIYTFGEYTKACIGEPDKNKRVCRYCHRSMPEVSFKKTAHTISEALGNKHIKTNDECDECNQSFGDTIEQDFLSLFDVPRLIFGIKNKEGYPHKFIGDNYSIEKDANGNLKIGYRMKDSETIPQIDNFLQKVMLTPHRSFPEQNIYKALCKYIFGVLDNNTILNFERTRKWLNGENKEVALPQIARFYHPEVVAHPHITLYVRKKDARRDLPHVVAEIRIINLAFVVILPLSEQDICTYNEVQDYQRFWDFFDVYNKVAGWQFSYCNGLESKHPTVLIKFTENK